MEQSGNGMAGMGRNAAGFMADSLLLYQLLGITPDLYLFPMQKLVFIQSTWRLGFTSRSACLASYLIKFLLIIYFQ